MKTIGLIGGTTWLSTVDYYQLINQKVNEKLGGDSSAKILLYSLDFAVMKKLANEGRWSEMAEVVSEKAKMLESEGADCLLLCANTMHIVAGDVRKSINIPLIHIAEETTLQIKKSGIKKAGLLGTKFTMESDFFKNILSDSGIETIIPVKEDRDFIHESIFSELGKNIFKAETKNRYIEIINKLAGEGAEGIILGCTEIPLIIKVGDCAEQMFNTTLIHVNAAVKFALG
jgi:aspartate racemase